MRAFFSRQGLPRLTWGLGLVLAGLAAAEPPRFAWPPVRALEYVEASEVVRAHGTPVALKALTAREKPSELVPLFLEAFRRGGLYVMPRGEQPQLVPGLTLTALDARKRISYSVILWANPDGTTTVVLGEAHLGLHQEPAGAPFAPVYPGAERLVRSDQESAQVMGYTVQATEQELLAFYRAVLKGWTEGGDTREAGVFTREGQELRVTSHPGEQGGRAVLVMLRSRAH